jgi:F0F1-type ATP synthase membrane subunit c/vacuolar-type H+-ATPase subunit K
MEASGAPERLGDGITAGCAGAGSLATRYTSTSFRPQPTKPANKNKDAHLVNARNPGLSGKIFTLMAVVMSTRVFTSFEP